MRKFAVVLLICLSGNCLAGPMGPKRNMYVVQQKMDAAPVAEKEATASIDPNEMIIMSSLSLPSNATSIRADITDGFSCDNKTYGYYADVDNDCQIFHVCLPVTYADGKENTFRWSFICPEDTIFSQDSFTCMRPDDMTITCGESYQYYELNRNFGVVESASDKEQSNEANGEPVEETVLGAVAESAPAAPIIMEEEEEEEEKVSEKTKPVFVQKPNRRKPSISYLTQRKQTNSFPLRKIPQIQEQVQTPERVEEQKSKPITQKFSRRPTPAASSSLKDRIQSSKPDSVVATRTELFNQIRKRPVTATKKPIEKVAEEKHDKQTKIVPEQQTFSPVASDMPIASSEIQVADTEAEASEKTQAFIEPEKANEGSHGIENSPIESVNVLEAFEEIPAVISEVVETASASESDGQRKPNLPPVTFEKSENSHLVREPQITEDVQSAEEIQTDVQVKDVQPIVEAHETNAADETKTAEELVPSKGAQVPEENDRASEIQSSGQAADVQSLVRTSAEVTQTVDEAKEAEEHDEASPLSENADTAEDSKNSGVQEENQDTDATAVTEDDKAGGESPDDAASGEVSGPEYTESEEKRQAIEDEIAEGKPSLGTSAEESLSSEKTHDEEEIPMIGVQEAEKSPVVAQNGNDETAELPEMIQNAEPFKEVEEFSQESERNDANQEAQVMQKDNEKELEDPIRIASNEEEAQSEIQKSAEAESAEVYQSFEENIESAPGSVEDAAESVNSEKSEEVINSIHIPTVGQMEAEKIADSEMASQSTVEQRLPEGVATGKKSVGGFKPVDPAMAHEAEQLIVDFINTLRKNEFTNETPGKHVQQSLEKVAEEQHPENNSENDEKYEKSPALQGEEHVMTEEMDVAGNEEHLQANHEEAKPLVQENDEDHDLDTLKAEENEKLAEGSPEATNLPQEILQIPVQVITTPLEQMPLNGERAPEDGVSENTQDSLQEESQPLSIDDIVELVKERLDQMPKDEMKSPMQLEQVIGAVHKDKAAEVGEDAAEDHQQSNQAEEEMVMPIYQRTAQLGPAANGLPNGDIEQVSNVEQAGDEEHQRMTDAKEKTTRSYRSHSVLTRKLDPRKRHFLFKTDLS